MKPVKKSVVAIVAGVACLLGLWLSPASAATSSRRVKLAYSGWGIGTAVAYVGIDGSIFKQYDVDIEEVFIQDALSGGIQSLIGVDVVLGFGNPLAIFSPILKGADIVFLGSHVKMEQYAMVLSSGLSQIKDLRGKKIDVSALGERSDLIARIILRRAGLDPVKDVQIVAAGLSPNRIAALSQNKIQGAPLNPETASGARELGLKVLEVKEVPVIDSLLMTTRSFVQKDQEAVRRFTKGYVAAIHYYLSHRNESIAIIKKYFSGAAPSTLETMYDSFAAQLKPLPIPNGEAMQAAIDAVSVADQKAKALKPLDLFEPRFLEELKSSGFLKDLYAEKVSL
ncbi:MAG: ABC transporter substrate-binding protein [Deltaproteobacteria bacterium]|nr:MAG: ABC transporter substrate-binding protein [Deltaproteobacteria bacterium]